MTVGRVLENRRCQTTGRHSIESSADRGPGDHIPPLTFHGFGGRAASLTHQKKKKKKVERSRGRGGVEVEVEVEPTQRQ